MTIRPATQADHLRLCELSRSHPAGRGFTNTLMFSGAVHYEKGWLRVAETDTGEIIGYTCFRFKKRATDTHLYYVIVDPKFREQGVGKSLMADLIAQSKTQTRLTLDCMKDNAPALKFYDGLGFVVIGESQGGRGLRLAVGINGNKVEAVPLVAPVAQESGPAPVVPVVASVTTPEPRQNFRIGSLGDISFLNQLKKLTPVQREAVIAESISKEHDEFMSFVKTMLNCLVKSYD